MTHARRGQAAVLALAESALWNAEAQVSTQLGRVERLLSEGHDPGHAQAILRELLRILQECQNRRAALLSAAGQG